MQKNVCKIHWTVHKYETKLFWLQTITETRISQTILSYDAHNSKEKFHPSVSKPKYIPLYILRIQSRYIYQTCPDLLVI
jgi:hypothetical protein